MHSNILWKSLYCHSLENCVICKHNDKGAEIESTIVGSCEGKLFSVNYRIVTDSRWRMIAANIDTQLNGQKTQTVLEWRHGACFINGVHKELPAGTAFIDISLTPFTNTLPINNLQMRVGEMQTIKVVYIDILGQKITPASQNYTRLTEDTYLFETEDHSFRAEIRVDANGIVLSYPQLFETVHQVNA